MKSDKYYTAPLAVLRSGNNALEALGIALACGIVNAGLGFREDYGEDDFDELVPEAEEHAAEQGQPTTPPKKFEIADFSGNSMTQHESETIWRCALVGAKMLGIRGGNRAEDAQTWATHYRKGEVFFTIKSEWLWAAIWTARREAGTEVPQDFKPLSWREFRVLAAILSAGVQNYHGFVFLGWESIQARACGFHRKDLFQAGKNDLCSHCQPFSRDQIMRTTGALEACKFYLRFRYSKGDRGGKTAYSFRHESREKLAEAVAKFQAEYCFKQAAVSDNRAKDRILCAKMQEARKPPAT